MFDAFDIPKVLWLAIFSLAIFSLFHIAIGFSSVIQLFAFSINIVLIYGLLLRQKWAFFLAIVASLTAPLMLWLQSVPGFTFILIINCTVLIPVLMCRKSFFPKNSS